jgi:tetratricopeptide (TPR) repeat protein
MAAISGVTSGTTSWLTPGISALATIVADTSSTTTVGLSSATAIDNLYTSDITYSQTSLDSLANTALSQGIDFYQNGNYDRAINSFKSSAGLSPFSDNSASAYNYMAQAYLKLDKTDQAIKTYKEAIGIYPVRDDFHLALGDIYLKEGNADEALSEYKAAVRLDPTSADNIYSLGQSYLSAGQLDAAKEQFQAVTKLSPQSATGYYGLGQVARANGDLQGAVSQFKKALSVDKTYLNAYQDLGYAYADMGDFQDANNQLAILQAKNTTTATNDATNLQKYISQATAPKITNVSTSSVNGFNTKLGPATSISQLNANMATPGDMEMFSMNFKFSKKMDQASVINPYNWSISRASIQANGGIYNGGLPVPQTEAIIPLHPISITYTDTTNTATIEFPLSQNATGNATIDPNHIVFKFNGQDAYGKAMDLSADQFSGFSSIA